MDGIVVPLIVLIMYQIELKAKLNNRVVVKDSKRALISSLDAFEKIQKERQPHSASETG